MLLFEKGKKRFMLKRENLEIRTVYAYKTCERKRHIQVKNDSGFLSPSVKEFQ